MQNSISPTLCCDTIAVAYNGAVPNGLYVIMGECDQSAGGGELLNVAGAVWALDGDYTSGTRSNYALSLNDEGTNVLSPDNNWYQVKDSRLCDLTSCVCLSVFNQVSGTPSEDDSLIAQGFLRRV